MKNTIFELMIKRGEIAGSTSALKADLDAIDRALVLCDYEYDPKGIAPRTKYKQQFGRKGWDKDAIWPDVVKRARDALQREQKIGRVVQDFGPDGCLWRLAE